MLIVLANCKNDAVVSVNIEVDDVYEITDQNELETTLNTTYTSSDSTVAVLRSGKYICGLRPGKTRIEVDCEGQITRYDVVVASDNKGDKAYITTQTVPKNDIKIGYCFNVLEGKEFDQNAIGKECVFDWEKVYKSGNIRVDGSNKLEFTSYSAATMDSFLDAYSKKETVKIAAKLGKIKLFEKTISSSESSKTSNTNIKSINQLYWKLTKATYNFREPEDGYAAYLKEDVKASLMGTDGTTVEQFIEKYGTHVIVAGVYGGSFEINYTLDDKKFVQKNKEIMSFFNKYMKIYNNTNEIFAAISRNEGDKLLLDDYVRKLNLNEQFLGGYRVEGEGQWKWNSMEIANFNEVSEDFIIWLSCLKEEDGVDFYDYRYEYFENAFSYLSPINDKSLIAVWDLIDTSTDEGKKRKEAFIASVK